MNPNHVHILDTPLRDGEQSPGASLTSAEKLEIARALARMGVDVIEAGFPAASPDDLEGVRRIAQAAGNPAPGAEVNAGAPRRHIAGAGRSCGTRALGGLTDLCAAHAARSKSPCVPVHCHD